MPFAENMIAGAGLGFSQAAANALNMPKSVSPAPQTISSALSRLDSLNERLVSLRATVGNIADQIGGPRPTTGEAQGANPPPVSAVGKLNDASEAAHRIVSDIEETLQAIGRALG